MGVRAVAGSGNTTRGADVGALYRSFAPRLERIVGAGLALPEQVVQDACQLAWGKLVDHHHSVRREAVRSWLQTTAIREAMKLARGQERWLPLEAAAVNPDDYPRPGDAPDPLALIERRELIELLARLPRRQQRLLWLHAVGLSYAEIADRTGDSVRTVERQLLRARRSLRALAS